MSRRHGQLLMKPSTNSSRGAPCPSATEATLRLREVVAMTVGIVIGAGIFKTPSLVAANTGSARMVVLAWVLGGVVSLIGALCYAELATTYPHTGGDYHYLRRAFGPRLSFLFAWARLSVIQTGSMALLAFVFGDHATQILSLGEYSSPVYAALVILTLTGVNIIGVRQGVRAQNWLTCIEVVGLAAVVVTGLVFAPQLPADMSALHAPGSASTSAPLSSFGLAMVFVLLTYGGWNEAVYLSAELRDTRRQMGRALVWSLLIITTLYVLVNWAYLKALGLTGMAQSEAIASEVMRRAFGGYGAALISLLIAISALTSANATLFTGARASFALGRDFPALAFLGQWSERAKTPVNALLVQGAVALALVCGGAWTRKGFETIVEYTAPVFWLFFLLTGISLFVLRRKEPQTLRPFRVPLYPFTPLLFCATSAYLLYSSLAYTGVGALVGIAVLAVGILILVVIRPRSLSGSLDYQQGDN
jgi:APA family basic amino acid/polyamine antiporter